MPEIAGQLITGRPMTERECFQGAIHGIQTTRDCLRGLALLRNDMRWLIPVRLLDTMKDSIERLMIQKERKLLWLPHREPKR